MRSTGTRTRASRPPQVCFSPDWPNLLASADMDNRVFVWDIAREQKTPHDFTSPPQVRMLILPGCVAAAVI